MNKVLYYVIFYTIG